MAQSIVIPNKDNLVVLTFAGVDLTLATNIIVNFGAETYNLAGSEVTVDSATQLSLDLSATSEVGQIFVTVTYFDSGSVNGTDITSQEIGNLGRIIVAVGTQLIIEDGTQVVGSNSYASDTEYKSYAALRGQTVSATQPEREANLIAAMDYLKATEGSTQGRRVSSTQSLPFPRVGVWLYGYSVTSTTIPSEIKTAQLEAALFAESEALLSNSTGDNVKRQKLDVMEVEYFGGGKKTNLQRVNAYLAPLLMSSDSLVRT